MTTSNHYAELPASFEKSGWSISASDGQDKFGGNLWRALYHFNLYRLFLSGGLLTLSLTLAGNSLFGQRSPTLFLAASLALAATSLINILIINAGKPDFHWQASWQIASDIIIITLLMHSSDGINSGFGLLLLVSIAGSGVVLSGRRNLGFAAMATVCFMTEAVIRNLIDGRFADLQPIQLAMLGIACFATAIAMSFVSSRVRKMETLAEQRAIELEMLTHANAHIVQQIDTGVVLLGDNDRILLTNEKSRRLLGLQPSDDGTDNIGPALRQLVDDWRISPTLTIDALPLYADGPAVEPRILAGPNGADRGLVILLEDVASKATRAQEIKLAALGRLTAAISHEIRNPLSAISHASELLAESTDTDQADRRLIEIIQNHSARINNIIQSVLHLGKRGQVAMQQLELTAWATELAAEICHTYGLRRADIVVRGEPQKVEVNSDQLMQIVTNLCENAIRHNKRGSNSDGSVPIAIEVGRSSENRPVLDVVDAGLGVEGDKVDMLFEPFFTTEAEGTGLGLYISRELAAANGATLNYIKDQQPGARFRVEFYTAAKPGR